MAVVLAATGLFLYLRLEPQPRPVDRPGPPLARRRPDLTDPRRRAPARRAGPQRPARAAATSFAQVAHPAGTVCSSPRPSKGARPAVLSPAEVDGHGAGPVFVERSGAARPRRRAGSPAGHPVSQFGAAPADRRRRRIARRPRRRPEQPVDAALIGGPVALLLASLAAYWHRRGRRCARSRRCAGAPPRSRPPRPTSASRCRPPTTSSAGSARP